LREIALHILDLIENSIRAGATVISVAVEEEPDQDLLLLSVEDNGPGLGVSGETAADPFFTTKGGKKTGLGLSMLKFRAEQAGGSFRLESSSLGGLAVRAAMPLSHVDRSWATSRRPWPPWCAPTRTWSCVHAFAWAAGSGGSAPPTSRGRCPSAGAARSPWPGA